MYTVNVRNVIEQKLDELYRNQQLNPESYFSPEDMDGYYGSIRSGKWFHAAFEEVQKLNESVANLGLLSLIVYTDATAVGAFGNHSMKPIYISFGNSVCYSDSIAMIGFFPELAGTYSKTGEIPESKTARRELTNLTWKHIVDIMQLKRPIEAFGKTIVLKIAFVAGDHPEQQKTSLCFDSNRTPFPCRSCFISRENLNWLGRYPKECHPRLRTPITVFELISEKNLKLRKQSWNSYWATVDETGRHTLSMHPETPIWTAFNVFWETAGIYQHSPPCIMHCLSLGIYKACLNFCVDMVQHRGHKRDLDLTRNECPPFHRPLMASSILPENQDDSDDESCEESEDCDLPFKKPSKRPKSGAAYQRLFELDLRIASIPGFCEKVGEYKKRFKKGLSNLTYLTGGEYDEAIRIIIFAIRDSTGFFMDEDTNIKLIECFLDLRELLEFVRKPIFSDHELEKFVSEFLPRLRQRLFASFGVYQKSNWNLVKVHMLQHLPLFIRKFGCPANFDTSYFEVFHKHVKKLWGLYKGEKWPMKVLKCMEFLRVRREGIYNPLQIPECPDNPLKTSTRVDMKKTRARYGVKYIDDLISRFTKQFPHLTVSSSCDSLKVHRCRKSKQGMSSCYDNWIRSKWMSGYTEDDVSNLHCIMVSRKVGKKMRRDYHRVSLFLIAEDKYFEEFIVIVGETFEIIHEKDPIMKCPKVQTMARPNISFISADCDFERVLVVDDFDWMKCQDEIEQTYSKAKSDGKLKSSQSSEKEDPDTIIAKVAYVALFDV
jgi:hypothetical protein